MLHVRHNQYRNVLICKTALNVMKRMPCWYHWLINVHFQYVCHADSNACASAVHVCHRKMLISSESPGVSLWADPQKFICVPTSCYEIHICCIYIQQLAGAISGESIPADYGNTERCSTLNYLLVLGQAMRQPELRKLQVAGSMLSAHIHLYRANRHWRQWMVAADACALTLECTWKGSQSVKTTLFRTSTTIKTRPAVTA